MAPGKHCSATKQTEPASPSGGGQYDGALLINIWHNAWPKRKLGMEDCSARALPVLQQPH